MICECPVGALFSTFDSRERGKRIRGLCVQIS